jgi:molybdopterin converting factor small subunit
MVRSRSGDDERRRNGDARRRMSMEALEGRGPTSGGGQDDGGQDDAVGQVVTARLFAGLEALVRERRHEWRVPAADAATVTELCASIGLPPGVVGLILVNGVHADAATNLRDGDEVSLFPPVGGG